MPQSKNKDLGGLGYKIEKNLPQGFKMENDTYYTIYTNDPDKMKDFLLAGQMRSAIESCYTDCMRQYLKYGVKDGNIELTSEELDILEEVSDKIIDHFAEVRNQYDW
jgi:hypothetical protein